MTPFRVIDTTGLWDSSDKRRVLFTSDLHYGHANICRGSSKWTDKSRCRDFQSLNEMNQAIVRGVNSAAGPNDILVHLGDWSFGGADNIRTLRHYINCREIHHIIGNHDHHILKGEEHSAGFDDCFASVGYYDQIMVDGQRIVLSHYAMRIWNEAQKGAWMLYGHSHGTLPDDPRLRSMDVGIDTHPQFRPYTMQEIRDRIGSREFKAVDHHTQETR